MENLNEKNIGDAKNRESAITLISLVVTIIILLILAGVIIGLTLGQKGIYRTAKQAKEQTEISNIKEQIQIDIVAIQTKNFGNITRGQLDKILSNYGTVSVIENKKILTTKNGYEISIAEIYNGDVVVTLADQVEASNYGEDIDYPIDLNDDGDKTNDWKIFYKDTNDNIYIIANKYVLNTSEYLNNEETGMSTYSTYGLYWKNSSNFKHLGTENIDTNVASEYMFNWGQRSTNENAKITAALLDTKAWNKMVNKNYAESAIGGPTLEMFCASWNAKGYTKLYCNKSDSVGYYIGNSNQPETIGNWVNEDVGYNDELYFPNKESEEECVGYWVATPSANAVNHEVAINYDGHIYIGNKEARSLGVRPVILLKSGIIGEKDQNGKWKI